MNTKKISIGAGLILLAGLECWYCYYRVNGHEFHPLQSPIALRSGQIESPEFVTDQNGTAVVNLEFHPYDSRRAACLAGDSRLKSYCDVPRSELDLDWRIIQQDHGITKPVTDWDHYWAPSIDRRDHELSTWVGQFQAHACQSYKIEFILHKDAPELSMASPSVVVFADPLGWKSWVGWLQLSAYLAVALAPIGLCILIWGLFTRDSSQAA